ncbi:hypothetical protein Gpo141_00014423, partial [Globisporangium polare]
AFYVGLKKRASNLKLDRRIGRLSRAGVLPNLAVAFDKHEMLPVLYALSKQPMHLSDHKLSFKKVMRYAVIYNRIDALECLTELFDGRDKKDSERRWEPDMMRFAITRSDPDLRVLEWLYTHLPPVNHPLRVRDLLLHTQRGDLDVVQWLYTRKPVVSEEILDAAAKARHLHVLRYLYAQSPRRCRRAAVNFVAGEGFLDVVQFIVEKQSKEKSYQAINFAAGNGHLDIVKYLVESKIRLEAPRVIDCAAGGGHLDVVKYLHALRPRRWCSVRAMDSAAANGHVEVVRFLHENRREGCSPSALDGAARNGHLAIVEFLFEKYALPCSVDAMDDAATAGHLTVVQFLHVNEIGRQCSSRAMDGAAEFGHLEVVKFLHENRSEGCTTDAMDGAIVNGHLEVVRFLHEHRNEGWTTAAMTRAVKNCRSNAPQHLFVIRFLLEHRSEHDLLAAMAEAVACGHLAIVKLLHSHLRTGESVYPALNQARSLNYEAVRFLCGHQEHEPRRLLLQAVANGAERIVSAVLWHSHYMALPREELVEAKALALELGSP